MLRVLAVRQGLLALNALLGALLLLVIVQIVRQALLPAVNPSRLTFRHGETSQARLELARLRDRGAYNEIATRQLFGAAGAYAPGKQAAAPPPPPPTDATEETTLPLKLFGTSLSEGPNPRAAAIIDVRGGNGPPGTRTFYLGDEVMSEVVLDEVRAASVVLDNRRDNRRELLSIDWNVSSTGVSMATSRTLPSAVATVNRPNLITLERADITKRVEEEYARVASSLDVKIVNGPDGNVQGITTDNIEQYDVARELGFKNGDVLVSVNNEPVRSREDAVNVVKKYQSASIFRVGVLRGGQMQYITYRIR